VYIAEIRTMVNRVHQGTQPEQSVLDRRGGNTCCVQDWFEVAKSGVVQVGGDVADRTSRRGPGEAVVRRRAVRIVDDAGLRSQVRMLAMFRPPAATRSAAPTSSDGINMSARAVRPIDGR
jgi:hypothetical protein